MRQSSQAFYSRDIADPSWGIKLTGKEGKSAFGAIIARDDLTNFIFPGNQFSSLGWLILMLLWKNVTMEKN
ncbi:hypothetical protein L0222_18155 [bacterium]|nr:hypothetical protein [bacterium]MCI0603032.1 hypothetical protein [bacterium]